MKKAGSESAGEVALARLARFTRRILSVPKDEVTPLRNRKDRAGPSRKADKPRAGTSRKRPGPRT